MGFLTEKVDSLEQEIFPKGGDVLNGKWLVEQWTKRAQTVSFWGFVGDEMSYTQFCGDYTTQLVELILLE